MVSGGHSHRGFRQNPTTPMLFPTLFVFLLALVLGHAALAPGEMVAKDLQLRFSECPDGACDVGSVFCSTSKGLGVVVQTPNPAQAAASMCALQGLGFLNNSAADYMMAGRFGGGTNGGAYSVGTFSTEPNTPWMMADYSLTLTVLQSRLDSAKAIAGFAQVDLLLCSDPNCSVVADLQHILHTESHNNDAVLAMGFSGLPLSYHEPKVSRTGAGVSLGTIRDHDSMPQLRDASGSLATDLDGNVHANEVHWRVPSAKLIDVERWQAWNFADSYGAKGTALVPLAKTATTSLGFADVWGFLLVGHYRATSIGGESLSGEDACVTIIWPKHQWLIERGWNHSDSSCVEEYVAAVANSSKALPPVYLFDSYVPQAHVLLNPRLAGAVRQHHIVADERNSRIYNISFLAGSPFDLAAPLTMQASRLSVYPAGLDSMTLSKDGGGSTTQERDNCIKGYEHGRFHGGCDVLIIGTAAVAVRSLQGMVTAESNSEYQYTTAISKLRHYALYPPTAIPPWCSHPVTDNVEQYVFSTMDSAGDSGNSSSNRVYLFENYSGIHQDMTHVYEAAARGGVLYDCSMLKGLGLGFVNHTWSAQDEIVPGSSASAFVPATALVQSQFWVGFQQDTPHDKTLLPETFLTPLLLDDDSSGLTTVEAIKLGVERVVQEAATLLNQRATEELVITDATRRWPGALLDLSLTVVAIVAMASGLQDIHEWLYTRLIVRAFGRCVSHRFLWIWVCKPLTACIVLAGLFLAPVFILVADMESHQSNASGTSSRVGWLAADTHSTTNDTLLSPYMVVAAFSFRLVSLRDELAYRLEVFNVCLAGLASFCILYSLVCRLPFSHQVLPTESPGSASEDALRSTSSCEKAQAPPPPTTPVPFGDLAVELPSSGSTTSAEQKV